MNKSAHLCEQWLPNKYMPSVCMGCGGEWTDHSNRPFQMTEPPKVNVRFSPLVVAPSAPIYAVGGSVVNPISVIVRRVMEPGATKDTYTRTTLGFGAIERMTVNADGSRTEQWHNVAVVIDTVQVDRIADALAGLTGAFGVEVYVPGDRIIAETDHAIMPAVYVGPDTGVEGRKPTLIQGQGLVIVGGSGASGEGWTVVYDPIDPKVEQTEWKIGTRITDVQPHHVVTNANWRNWMGPKADNWLGERTFVASSIVPSGPVPKVDLTGLTITA